MKSDPNPLYGKYRCPTGTYKVVASYERVNASSFGFGGFCRIGPGGVATYSRKQGLTGAIDLGGWDEAPKITLGRIHDGGGQCSATGDERRSGMASGKRNGAGIDVPVNLIADRREAWLNAYGENGATITRSAIYCQGWSNRDPQTGGRDPNGSPFDECIGNQQIPTETTVEEKCTLSSCEGVGWNLQ